jgi:hypothetical protein
MPLRVTVEIVPHGYESRKRRLAILHIENMDNGTETHNRYLFRLESGLSDSSGAEPGSDYRVRWGEIMHPVGADRMELIGAVVQKLQGGT